MAAKTIFALCAVALIQSAISCGCGSGLNLGGCGSGLNLAGCGSRLNFGGCGGGVSSTGGNFPAASSSPARPDGVSVLSDSAYEGQLCIAGNLPFLGTVALEGLLPTRGAGQVSYGCGNGNVGITSEVGSKTGIASPGTYQPGPGALGCGCGCGRV